MLSPDVLRQVKRVQIRTRRLVDGIFAGEYHSVFKGRGMEFAEVREYVPGDDIRTIDWNVTARLGHPYVKKHVEERELTVMLLVDISASGAFGSADRSKGEIAAEIAAVLAMSAINNNDKVGLILFSDRIEKFVPPQKGRNKVLRLIREILYADPEGTGTDIGRALDYLCSTTHRRSVGFLISDFLGTGYEKSVRVAHQRHDIVPICLIDPREDALPQVGLVWLEDLETGELVLVDTDSREVRDWYRGQREQTDTRRRQFFRSIGLDTVDIRTDQPYFGPLLRFFRNRERRLAQGR
ncbi:MAG: DUF58 domain-containing protein [Rhodospirillaceae bacterium]|nr:DUF58 domain-containing protein [Rhodospirillaceae bacterium]